jgi:Holliday junction resolvase
MANQRIRESTIERELVKRVQEVGGKAYKWVSPGNVGVPDRLVVLPYNTIAFVELKSPGNTTTEMQNMQIHILEQRLHTDVFVINSIEGVKQFVADIKALSDESKETYTRASIDSAVYRYGTWQDCGDAKRSTYTVN